MTIILTKPSPADADDVVQEAILRAFRGFDGLRGSDVKSWLFAIVRNCHLTALAQRERRGSVPLPEEHDPQDGHAMISPAPTPKPISPMAITPLPGWLALSRPKRSVPSDSPDRTMPRSTETITGLPLPSLACVIKVVYPVMICCPTARLATISGLAQAVFATVPVWPGAPPPAGLH